MTEVKREWRKKGPPYDTDKSPYTEDPFSRPNHKKRTDRQNKKKKKKKGNQVQPFEVGVSFLHIEIYLTNKNPTVLNFRFNIKTDPGPVSQFT